MSEPSTTRKTLRRAIAAAARMDFFRRYSAGEVSLTGTPSTTALASTSLTQSDNHWKGGWAYVNGEERPITAFAATGDSLTLEYALSSAPAAGDKLEIFEMWPPSAIHNAINRAIEIAARLFPQSITTDDFHLPADGIVSLTGLSPAARTIHRLWVDPNEQLIPGTLSDGTDPSTGATIESVTYNAVTKALEFLSSDIDVTSDDQYNGYQMQVPEYNPTITLTVTDTVYVAGGTHEIHCAVDPEPAAAAALAGTEAFVLEAPATTPRRNFFELRNFRLDAPEWPDTIYIESVPADLENYRLSLYYTGLPPALTADTDTTIVPAEYIIRRALALLHEDLINDNRADTQRHSQQANYFHAQADDFMLRFYTQRQSSGQKFQSTNYYVTGNVNDPLGWRD